ncbi:MAG TPA: hypothetical protein VFO38_00365 [Candidatus Saccharimonadales bacterium]|nr:hypothetical protein [Candidatus Saccharimonadales bacterium]
MLTITDARAVYTALINGEPPAFYEQIIKICSYLWLKPLNNQDRAEVRAIRVLAEQMIGIETPMRGSYHGCLLKVTRLLGLYLAHVNLCLVNLERCRLTNRERYFAIRGFLEQNNTWVQSMGPSAEDQQVVKELLTIAEYQSVFTLPQAA